MLRDDVQRKIAKIDTADILVGIPSFNNASTIGHVVTAVQAGLAKYFPGSKSVLVNSDGGSTDGTMDVVYKSTLSDLQPILISQETEPLFKIATPYYGIAGKGSAFRTIFEIAQQLRVKACAVVDSDLRSITPEWVELLLKPIFFGFDYVAPLYERHKYDGTITNSIIYPLTRSLYGKRIRQPIGGDFGFSGNLGEFYLTKDVWETDVARFGIDIWMTTTAITNSFRVCQAFLGAKIHDPKDPASDLSSMLYQVVGGAFDLMKTYETAWKGVKGSSPVPTFGFRYGVGLDPVHVNVERMIDLFRLGVRELGGLWEKVLSVGTAQFLQGLCELPKKNFHLPDEVWTEIVYYFAAAFHKQLINKEHLLKSITPLYLGRTASFVIETVGADIQQVEDKIERLCTVFENGKDLLLEMWETKDREG